MSPKSLLTIKRSYTIEDKPGRAALSGLAMLPFLEQSKGIKTLGKGGKTLRLAPEGVSIADNLILEGSSSALSAGEYAALRGTTQAAKFAKGGNGGSCGPSSELGDVTRVNGGTGGGGGTTSGTGAAGGACGYHRDSFCSDNGSDGYIISLYYLFQNINFFSYILMIF